MPRLCLLGAGLVGRFYAEALHRHRGRDRIELVYSRSAERAERLAAEWGIPRRTTDWQAAVTDPGVDAVIVALPNHLHEPVVLAAAEAGKAVLCTKPLARTAAEAQRMLAAVERHGVFHAYLEDLVFTPKTLKALAATSAGSIGRVLWVRSREAHPGPHSEWFWNPEFSGGGAIIDLGCHCIEIARSFIGKDVRPVEVMCWADTQAHAIAAEDHAIGLVRYANGAIGQFEVSWAFRGGMDLRDEVAGTDGTIWLNHWLRTGFDMFSAGGQQGYVAEKAEGAQGWLFPVGDEPAALGYTDMFADALESLERQVAPRETFYDGYVVNAIMDAAYASVRAHAWAPVELPLWRGPRDVAPVSIGRDFDTAHWLLKEERMPDGTTKRILKEKATGRVVERIEA